MVTPLLDPSMIPTTTNPGAKPLMRTVMMPILPLDTIEDIYPRYAAAWESLLLDAAARHRLSPEEFRDEMRDPRLEKHVVLDADDRVVAMTTMTTDLDAIPWINPAFYRQRYPDECANGTMFYLGYSFVDLDHQRTRAFAMMADAVDERLTSVHGVIGLDMCGFAIEHGIGQRLQRLFPSSREVVRGDTQTYLIADYRVPQRRFSDRFTLTSLAERPDLLDDVRLLLGKQWPAYTLTGVAGHGVDLDGLLLDLPAHQLLLLDEQEQLAGVGFSLPLQWDGTVDTLPAGWDDAIVVGEKLHRNAGRSDTVCVLSITVAPELTGRGLAERLIGAFKEQAADLGAHAVIIPVRPSQKTRYPLISMPEYLSWTRSDG